jgi:hypothetical protein
MKIKNTLICFLFFIFFGFSSYSQQLEQKGLGVEDYSKEGLFTDKTLIVEKALKKACKNAFDQYVKGFDETQRENFENARAVIEKDIDKYIDCQTIIEEKDDQDKKRYSVVVKALIDTSGIKVALSKGQTIRQTKREDRPVLVFHFFTRTTETALKKDNKVTKVDTATKTKDINQSEAVKDGDVAISSETTKTNKTVTGGNVVRAATKYTYKVSDGDTLPVQAGLNQVMDRAGYVLRPANRVKGLEAFQRQIMNEYSTKEQFSDELKNKIIDSLISNSDARYYVTGVFDIGEEESDPSDGNVVVNVSLASATAEDIKNGNLVASIGGVQAKGKGTTYAQAKSNAISLAAKKTGEEIVLSINQKDKN